ncbi:MAG: CBS domain-containing protein [Desulfocapsaceae bacterium]|nr:CBS domain-containing protein [Desulfocapsaceae bacterium]
MITAKEIMNTTFHSLHPETSVAEALLLFKKASEEEKRRVFGMMVIDDQARLVGILSMYDLLLFMQPKHVQIWGEMSDIDISGLLDTISAKTKDIRVSDIMTTDVLTIDGDAHIFTVLELMNRKHIRRLPVTKSEKVLGIVYISDLFFHLVEQMT